MKKLLLKFGILSLTILLTSTLLRAQSSNNDFRIAKAEAMKNLSTMEGLWKGEGWMYTPTGERKEFSQTEDISIKLDGLALIIEGKGRDKETNELVHNALAMVTYDLESKTYRFDSHLVDGRSTEAVGIYENNTFTWGFDVPDGGKVKYEITLTDKIEWNERGYYSRDGQNWNHFFEMTLTKEH